MEPILNALKTLSLKDIVKYPLAVFIVFLVYYFGKATSRNDDRCDRCESKLDSLQRENVLWMRKWVEEKKERETNEELYKQKDTLLEAKIIEPAKEALKQLEQ